MKPYSIFLLTLSLAGTSLLAQPLPPTLGPAAQPLLKASSLALSQGDLKQARKLLLQARQADPSLKGIDYHLATIAYASGEMREAEKLLRASLAAGDAVADSHNLLGGIFLRSGNLTQAIEHFEAATKADPKLPDAYTNLGAAYRLNFEPQKAFAPLRKAAELDPTQRPIHEFKLRLAMIEAGQSDEVEKTLGAKLAAPEVDADWILTAAALDLRKGRIAQGADRIRAAKAVMPPQIFAILMEDRAFKIHSDQAQLAEFYKVP